MGCFRLVMSTIQIIKFLSLGFKFQLEIWCRQKKSESFKPSSIGIVGGRGLRGKVMGNSSFKTKDHGLILIGNE